ncbi:hypothetical protein ACK30U_14865 [Aeromonas caviae]
MKTKVMILAGCLALSAHVTAQEQGIWYSWSGPGTQANYAIDTADGTSLSIVCKDAEPVAMYATVKGVEYGSGLTKFTLMVDGTEYITPPYQLSQFDDFWDSLRHATMLHIATRKGVLEIPTTGILDALSATNSADYNCYTKPSHSEAKQQSAAASEPAFDVEKLAVPATTADMSQTQLEAGASPSDDETQTWYERMYHKLQQLTK